MEKDKSAGSDQNELDPYLILGLKQGASYESIQKARDEKLIELGDDVIAKAKVEGAYDSLLMVSLKARQLGEISNAAISASKRDGLNKEIGKDDGNSIFSNFTNFSSSRFESLTTNLIPDFNFPTGQGLTIRISLGILVLVILLISPPASISTILSLSIIAILISQVKRGRPLFSSFLWGFALLSVGIIFGFALFGRVDSLPVNTHLIAKENLQALPAVILLWLGTLLLD